MRQPHKMVKHIQTSVFDHFVGLTLKWLNGITHFSSFGSNNSVNCKKEDRKVYGKLQNPQYTISLSFYYLLHCIL